MGYVFLGLAIIACVAGSSALTASDGMVIKKYGSLGVLIFAFSYVLLSRSILTINISIAYVVWSGVGIIFLAIVSVAWFHLPLKTADIIGLIMITIGVVGMDLFGAKEDPDPESEGD